MSPQTASAASATPHAANVAASARIILTKLGSLKPKVAVILGSGLGGLGDKIENAVKISYADLPGFPVLTVVGHAGELIAGKLNGVDVIAFKGRKHFYETDDPYPLKTMIRTAKAVGVEVLFVSNAAGSLRADIKVSELMAISDHINFLGTNPLIGANDEEFGPRFVPLSDAWDAELRDKLKQAARDRLAAEFAGATRQRLKRTLLDRLDENHKFEAPPSLVDEEFNLMWNSVKAEMESSGKTFADENTTEEAAREEYRTIADRRVRLGLVLSEIGEKNKITVTDDEVSRAVIERARSMPGREKEVWDYYRNNANALAQLRAPIFEDKVVDFILELANVTEKKVPKEDLFKDEDAEKSAA